VVGWGGLVLRHKGEEHMNDDDDIQEYVNTNKQRNDVLEEVAKEIEKMKAFEKDTMDSFVVFIREMKR
jgi:hypothetical protein